MRSFADATGSALSGLDAAIVLAFAAWAMFVGWRARREASQGLEAYFLAGRSLSGWRAGLSMAATQFAADTPLLITGLIATAGIFSLWRLWIYALAFLLLGFLLAPCWRRARVVTDAELAELRYGSRGAAWLRGVKALYFGTVFNCVVLAMVCWAAKEIAEPFLPWHDWLPAALFEPVRGAAAMVAIPFASAAASDLDVWTRSADNLISLALLLGVTAFYSASGGLRGVVRTDVVQLALMLGATAAYAAIVLAETGGPAELTARLRELHDGGARGLSADEVLAFTPSRAHDAGFALLGVLGLQWLVQMNADGTGYLAQRAMACRSDADAVRASVVFSVTQILLRSLLWLPIGVGLLVLFPVEPGAAGAGLAAEREQSFVRGMAELLPAGLRGAMLAAMLAALASTIDTHVNWGASYWSNDLYGRFWCAWRGRPADPRTLVRVARISSAALLVLALGVMTRLDSIQTAWQTSLLLGAGVGVTLVLRWLWWRITAWGELAAIAASLVLAPTLFWLSDQEALRLLGVALGSTAAAIAVSLAGPSEPRAQLVEFYRRVRPPGYWGPIAREVGDDAGPRRLARGLAATVTSALCLFCALTGLGTWLVRGTPPLWLPQRTAWVALLLALAAALAPLAWKLAEPLLRDPKPGEGDRARP
jgi:Na+/proline symporter